MRNAARKLAGYEECRCILTQYCDGKCRPVFVDVPDEATPTTTEHDQATLNEPAPAPSKEQTP